MKERVIIYISPHRNLYGAERSLLSMMKGTRSYGFKPVLVIGGDGPIEQELKSNSIEYIKHPFCGWVNMEDTTHYYIGVKCMLRNFIYSKKLGKIIRERYQDVVLVHTNSIITGFGIQLARELHVPHVYHIREFGQLDFHMGFNLGRRLTAHIIKHSKAIICISNAVKDYYENLLKCSNLKMVYNGISMSVIDRNTYKKDNLVKILLAGRLSKEKGHQDVIEAAEKLLCGGIDNFQISFYGDGVDEKKLKKTVEDRKLSGHIIFEGFSNEIPYGSFSCAIMASTAEAFGRVTVEYMLNGLPVIGADCGATAELIQDNVSGLLYHSGDTGELAECLKKLIEDSELRTNLGRNAQRIALEKFTEEVYWKNIMAVYAECGLEIRR